MGIYNKEKKNLDLNSKTSHPIEAQHLEKSITEIDFWNNDWEHMV